MKVAVVGSRTFTDYLKLASELDFIHTKILITLIISGGARGADSLAEEWALRNNVDVQIFLPDWEKDGKIAGFIRNRDIINSAELCLAFWDKQSRGTLDSINLAKRRKIPLKIVYF